MVHLGRGEVADGEGEVRGVAVQETSERDVHGSETTSDSEATTGELSGVRGAEVSGCQTEEGTGDDEEGEAEGDRRTKKSEQEKAGDDTPHDQIESNCLSHLVGVLLVGLGDAEPGDVEASERDPERAVAGESTSTEGVTASPLHAATEDLAKAAVHEGDTDEDVGLLDVTSAEVVEREKEGRSTEAHETERSGVGELTVEHRESGLRVVRGVSTGGDEAAHGSARGVDDILLGALLELLLSDVGGGDVGGRHCGRLVWS